MRRVSKTDRDRLIVVAPLAFSLMVSGCGKGATAAQAPAAQTGPPNVDVVRVVEQELDVTLSMPAELTAYQMVAIYPRVTGFVKSISVDRGSRVRAGQLLALLDAPELVAQRSEAQSKLQAAEAQLAAVRAKAEGDTGTYEKLKAAACRAAAWRARRDARLSCAFAAGRPSGWT